MAKFIFLFALVLFCTPLWLDFSPMVTLSAVPLWRVCLVRVLKSEKFENKVDIPRRHYHHFPLFMKWHRGTSADFHTDDTCLWLDEVNFVPIRSTILMSCHQNGLLRSFLRLFRMFSQAKKLRVAFTRIEVKNSFNLLF